MEWMHWQRGSPCTDFTKVAYFLELLNHRNFHTPTLNHVSLSPEVSFHQIFLAKFYAYYFFRHAACGSHFNLSDLVTNNHKESIQPVTFFVTY